MPYTPVAPVVYSNNGGAKFDFSMWVFLLLERPEPPTAPIKSVGNKRYSTRVEDGRSADPSRDKHARRGACYIAVCNGTLLIVYDICDPGSAVIFDY